MKALGLALVLGLVALTAACNTIEGAGRDIQSTGDTISDTARDVKNKL